jgi:hypothetical protein
VKYRNQVRTLAAGVLAGVAAIASYSHMRDLAAEHGQPEYLAKLLPISVDSLLVVASIVMTEDREAGRPARPWARASFVIGVVTGGEHRSGTGGCDLPADLGVACRCSAPGGGDAHRKIDIKIVSDQLGHSTTRITQDLYTHVRRTVHGQAAEAIVSLLPERQQASEETGS